MLTPQDLTSIRQIVDERVGMAEEKFHKEIVLQVSSSETRLRGEINTSETRLRGEIGASEARLRKEVSGVETRLLEKISSVEVGLRKEISDVEIRLRKRISDVEVRLQKRIVSKIRTEHEKTRNTFNGVIRFFDNERADHSTRIRKLEHHLGLAL